MPPQTLPSRRPVGLRARVRTVSGLLVALALVLVPLPAHAAPEAPAPPEGGPVTVVPLAPTPEEIEAHRLETARLDAALEAERLESERLAAEAEAQRLEAERLTAEVATQARLTSAARSRLSELADAAGEALEAYQAAVLARDAADTERRVQQERLEGARALVGEKRGDLGRWASSAYRDGGAMADYESLMTLLDSGTTDELGQRLVMLQRVGRLRGGVVTTVTEAESVQREAAGLARAASIASALASERATGHKDEADRLVAEQRQQIAVLDDLLGDTRSAAAQADQSTEVLTAARVAAEQRRIAAMAERDAVVLNGVVGRTGSCKGGEVSLYPNGAIPIDVLCPVAPGHHLRADAAFALQQLNDAYTEQWGTSVCLTDSYRTFESQISLFATKPELAAVPGTSNHGWGTALDLCGGIESFGAPAHQWMRDNAPLFGWFHPSWAQADGSRPEPWHWEFGG